MREIIIIAGYSTISLALTQMRSFQTRVVVQDFAELFPGQAMPPPRSHMMILIDLASFVVLTF